MTTPPSTPSSPPPSRDLGTQDIRTRSAPFPWRLILGIVLLALVIIFLVENTQRVAIRFVGPTVHAPLIVALLVAALLGGLGAVLVNHHRGNDKRIRRG